MMLKSLMICLIYAGKSYTGMLPTSQKALSFSSLRYYFPSCLICPDDALYKPLKRIYDDLCLLYRLMACWGLYFVLLIL